MMASNCTDADFAFALQLQYSDETQSKPKPKLNHSIIDESWELVDPTPDIYALFKEFDRKYFWGKLQCCALKWSPQMTLCAGVCRYEGRGGLCSIHLSQPLLKLRPRKDLVETLLHEMIHAYLFVTANNKDRDGHGPEFVKHMDRINQLTGAKITIYHSFHDEVELYRQHWWQCDGPCRKRHPYYGLLKRAINRPPGPSDPWWKDHQEKCGGVYTKIKSPEPKKGEKRKMKDSSPKESKGKLFTPFQSTGNVLGSNGSTQASEWSTFLSKKTNDCKLSSIQNHAKEIEPKSKMKQSNIENYIRNNYHKAVSEEAKKSKPHVIDLIDDEEDISELSKKTCVQCPVCHQRLAETKINDHLDSCLTTHST